ARLIIVAVTWLLHQRGLEWGVFTGAPALINSFHRLSLEPLHLGEANPSRLVRDQEQWGSYYEQKPQVFTGNIHFGYEQLQCNVVLANHRLAEADEAAHNAA